MESWVSGETGCTRMGLEAEMSAEDSRRRASRGRHLVRKETSFAASDLVWDSRNLPLQIVS